MIKRKTYQAIYERDEEGLCVVQVKAVPGCHTQDRTIATGANGSTRPSRYSTGTRTGPRPKTTCAFRATWSSRRKNNVRCGRNRRLSKLSRAS
jgi:hypothetical protein